MTRFPGQTNFPRLGLTCRPTPLQRLNAISSLLGREIWCKRDDLTGFAFGGNKVRKIDYLMADALGKGCDTIIAIGAPQSNFCRIAAAAGAVLNLNTILLLGGKFPGRPTANLLLDTMCGAEIVPLPGEDWSEWLETAWETKLRLEAAGRRVYLLPVGGSTPVGALGYVEGFLEMISDSDRAGLEISTIFHASSSGGTQAGLVTGAVLSGWEGSIIGVGAAKDGGTLAEEVAELHRETAAIVGAAWDPSRVLVEDGYLGAGYGHDTAACMEAREIFLKTEGIVLDDVYSGKAAAALLDYGRKGMLPENGATVFLHTGGGIKIFA